MKRAFSQHTAQRRNPFSYCQPGCVKVSTRAGRTPLRLSNERVNHPFVTGISSRVVSLHPSHPRPFPNLELFWNPAPLAAPSLRIPQGCKDYLEYLAFLFKGYEVSLGVCVNVAPRWTKDFLLSLQSSHKRAVQKIDQQTFSVAHVYLLRTLNAFCNIKIILALVMLSSKLQPIKL